MYYTGQLQYEVNTILNTPHGIVFGVIKKHTKLTIFHAHCTTESLIESKVSWKMNILLKMKFLPAFGNIEKIQMFNITTSISFWQLQKCPSFCR